MVVWGACANAKYILVNNKDGNNVTTKTEPITTIIEDTDKKIAFGIMNHNSGFIIGIAHVFCKNSKTCLIPFLKFSIFITLVYCVINEQILMLIFQ